MTFISINDRVEANVYIGCSQTQVEVTRGTTGTVIEEKRTKNEVVVRFDPPNPESFDKKSVVITTARSDLRRLPTSQQITNA